MSSKAMIFSDWHVHNYKLHGANVDRLDNCLSVLDELGKYCSSGHIDTIYFAGDLFDTHKALLTIVVNKTAEAFTKFFKEYPDVRFVAITGNHDQSTKNLLGSEAVSALTHLATFFPDNFILIDNDIIVAEDGVFMAGIPYYEYPEHFKQRLKEIADRVRDLKITNPDARYYLMIHQTPKGIGNDMIPHDCNPKDEDFDEFDLVFCGHIHKRQQLTHKFYVVGSPIHRDAGDKGEKKGFYIFNQLNPEKIKHFYLAGFPEFEEKYEDEVTEDDLKNSNKFLITKVRLDTIEHIKEAKVDEFASDLEATDLITNYWNEVDGKDEDLLKTGLKFIK